jgi:Leucine-rich repeat (LRR) protein
MINNMQSMRSLYLFETKLSGTLPATVAKLTQLMALRLHNTLISGTLPDLFGNMPALLTVSMHSNRLWGTPPGFGACGALHVLDLSNNSFDALPRSLPTGLTHLHLEGNLINCTMTELAEVLQHVPGSHPGR